MAKVRQTCLSMWGVSGVRATTPAGALPLLHAPHTPSPHKRVRGVAPPRLVCQRCGLCVDGRARDASRC